jgi:hypothetical protein
VKRNLRIVGLSALLGLLVVVIAAAGVVYFLVHFEDFSPGDVDAIIGVTPPPDASNYVIDGHKGLDDGIEVRFDAPPDSASLYARQFCGGVLYPGYNPFDAVDIGEPFTYAHSVSLSLFHYFSYSTKTPQTILGNRCAPLTNRGRVFHIVLDTANPEQTHVRAKILYSCNECKVLYTHSIQPLPDVPIWFVGLASDDGEYRTTDREICIGTAQDATDSYRLWERMLSTTAFPGANLTREAAEALAGWSEFFNAGVALTIDDQVVITATVNDELRLVGRRDGRGQPVAIEASGNEVYYCFDPGIEAGAHDMTLHVTTRAGVTSTYDWMLIKD